MGTVSVEDKSNHDDTLKLTDFSGSSSSATLTIDSQVSGTVEVWTLIDNTYDDGLYPLYLSGGGANIYIFMYGAEIWFGTSGTSFAKVQNCAPNTWYRFRLDFEFGNGGYMGLGQDQCDLYINDVLKRDNSATGSGTGITSIKHETIGEGWTVAWIDGLGFSWDPEYTVGDNKYPNAYVNETIDVELEAMTSHRLDRLEHCHLDYSFKTSIEQSMTVSLYNFANNTWIQIDSQITNNGEFYNGKFVVNDKNYINSEYEIYVQFYGENKTVEDFELHLQQLEVSYSWSKAHIDFGHNDAAKVLTFNVNMSSPYQYWYEEEFTFEYEGQYLVTTAADDGYATSKAGEVINIINPDPFAKIHNFPEDAYEDEAPTVLPTGRSLLPGDTLFPKYLLFWLARWLHLPCIR